MPYSTNDSLPIGVRAHLPKHAQDIYREAFNHAWEQYKSPSKRKRMDSQEVVVHKVAWSAVERTYYKNEEGEWIKIK